MDLKIGLVFALVAIPILASGLHFASSLWTYSIIVTGTLVSGVEAGCVLVQADNGTQYLLQGWSNYPPLGSRVIVRGYFETDVASYCMQGEAILHVVSISEFATASSSFVTGTATAISASTTQSTALSGVSATVSGYIYDVVENPQCSPQCGVPSFLLTYLYVASGGSCTGSMACYPPPQYYRLLNLDGTNFHVEADNGTYASVMGVVVVPSEWNCDSFYAPKICMTGDIYVQNVAYTTLSGPNTSTSAMITTETTTRYLPIPGFQFLSILIGLLVGTIAVLIVKRQSRYQ